MAQRAGDLTSAATFLAVTENLNTAPITWSNPRSASCSIILGSVARPPDGSNPRLKSWLARAGDRAANAKRLDEALDLHFEYGPKPVLPAPISRSDLRTIERAAALAPLDIATAIAYYQALELARRKDDAFWQLRRIMESPEAPAYIWYLAARAAHSRGEYEDAWQFLDTYEKKTNK